MKFALIDGTKTEATKGAKGICPSCSSELIAKCGEIKMNHWAHKGIRSCDQWWEPETEWHRSWKNNFSSVWQEITLTDEITGEKHIADVRTDDGLVIEFQHSHIDPTERNKREAFYKRMIWIVDGSRLKRDYPRFLKEKQNFRPTDKQGIFIVNYPEECFPSDWLGSSVPIIFDFNGTEVLNDSRDWKNPFYYLFPRTTQRELVLAIVQREALINSIKTGELYKESKPLTVSPVIQINPYFIRQRQSQFMLGRGRYIKRRRL